MNAVKSMLVDFLLETGSLQFGNFTLKSGRISPYFVNTAGFDTGRTIANLGKFYARTIIENFGTNFDLVFGPAYKGMSLSEAAAIKLWQNDRLDVRFAYDRKEPKKHGEGTKEEMQKNWIVGRIKDGDKIVLVDDVITTGGTKYDTLDLLAKCADNLEFKGLVIAVDRQETGAGSAKSAVEEFQERTGIPVIAALTATEILKSGRMPQEYTGAMEKYLLEFGTGEARRVIEK